MHAGGDQPGDVRHVDQQQRAHAVGDLAEAREVDDARVGAGAGDDQLGPCSCGQPRERVVVDALGLRSHAVAARR